MAKRSRSRHGSLQFYPRKRAAKPLHSVNWEAISAKEQGLLGLIVYKVGMSTALVKDNTDKVSTSKKQVYMPVTILEVPSMKIFSVRFYKHGKVIKDIVVSNDKELKGRARVPKQPQKLEGNIPKDFEDVRVIVYSMPKQTSIKKTPDMTELAIKSDNKIEFIQSLIGKEITFENFSKSSLIDVRGTTIGKGFQGPAKRFGITLRQHKSEKGVRKVGSIGPWHPAHITFRVPVAGQMGLHTRIIYNLQFLGSGKISEKNINPKSGFPHYGNIQSSYIIVSGSVQGPAKRQLLITPALRPSKDQAKRRLELIEVMTR